MAGITDIVQVRNLLLAQPLLFEACSVYVNVFGSFELVGLNVQNLEGVAMPMDLTPSMLVHVGMWMMFVFMIVHYNGVEPYRC